MRFRDMRLVKCKFRAAHALRAEFADKVMGRKGLTYPNSAHFARAIAGAKEQPETCT